MNPTIFFYLLSAFMLPRLFVFFRDEKISRTQLIVMTLIQCLLLIIFEPSLSIFLFAAWIILLNIFIRIFEQKNFKLNLIRFCSLLLAIAAGFIVSLTGINYNEFFSINFLNNNNAIESWNNLNVIFFGVLILLNEINFFIRYFFEALKLVPNSTKENEGMNEKTFNAGRVIGMLERMLIFFFVLINQFGAIGFIIAAKGFTRFKELDKRDFAEYVLIGTLLSSLAAMAAAVILKNFL
jgi:hypothetical protein